MTFSSHRSSGRRPSDTRRRFNARLLVVVLCGAMLCAWPLLARAQNGESDATAAANATDARTQNSINGRVVADDGQPLAHVPVIAFSPAVGRHPPVSVVTDADGKFSFNDLAATAYRLLARAPAYVSDTDFLSDPSEQTYYRVGDTALLRLTKGGVITGAVIDANGEPVVGASVRAVRVRGQDGRPARALPQFGYALERPTDDRGSYRLYGLSPGSYLVLAGGKGTYRFRLSAYDAETPTFYPSTTRDAAAEIAVAAGQEITNIDIRYRGEQGHTISGGVSGAVAESDFVSVRLAYVAGNVLAGSASIQPHMRERGFAFDALADGDYTLTAQGFTQEGDNNTASSPQRVTVRGADVTGVKLVLSPLGALSGHVIFAPAQANEGQAACPGKRATLPQELVVFARRHEPDAASNQPRSDFPSVKESTADAAGEFQLRNLEAGRYRLGVRLPGNDLYIRSISLTRPATSAPISTAPTPTRRGSASPTSPARSAVEPAADGISLSKGERVDGLTIMVSSGAALWHGRVVASTEGVPPASPLLIYLVPVERERADDLLRYAASNVGGDGRFAFNNLAPGRYRLVVRPMSDASVPDAGALIVKSEFRAQLRREAESANATAIVLAPCQRLNNFVLRFAPAKQAGSQ